jgi:DNA helicase-2/ATP-dependent DNA helicase PcrA
MNFVPSPQQAAFFKWVQFGKGSAFVEAVAGAGKTTTLIKALGMMNGSVAFAAYNKKIADEIKEKVAKLGLGNRVRVGTFHSFGFNAWRRVHPSVRLEADEKSNETKAYLLDTFARDSAGNEDLTQIGLISKVYPFITKLVSLAKQRAIGLHGQIDDQHLWYQIVDHFDMAYEIEDEELVKLGVELAIKALHFHKSIADRLIDFDDMIYMPVVTGVKVWENTWLLVDEAQDTNPARRALARKMLWEKGRAVFVGDRHQAIYGFTGADNDAVDQIIRDFRCTSLPLTITYRCPKNVVKVANEVVSHIEAHESAPEGTVTSMFFKDFIKQAGQLSPSDAILCRNTKPLVSTAFKLIRMGIACHVEGRDIGVGLIKLVDRYKADDLDELRTKLEDFRERETQKLVAKGKDTQAEALNDRIETIFILADKNQTIQGLKDMVFDMFKDTDGSNKESLTLSTVHKSKGREWPTVFIMGYEEFMPSPYARQDWQLQQEYNLKYVAVTRSMNELVMLEPPPKEE